MPDIQDLQLWGVSLDPIEKDPFFELFDQFDKMDLKGKTLIQALELVLVRGSTLLKSIKDTISVQKIPSLKYSESGKFEQTKCDEAAIMKTVNKSIAQLEYDQAIANMVCIANFYKKAYYRTKLYEPFFDYVEKIFKKFNEVQDLMRNYEQKLMELQSLTTQIAVLQQENHELRSDTDKLKQELQKIEKSFRETYLQDKVLRFFLNTADKKINRSNVGHNVIQVIAKILYDGRQEIADISKNMGMKVKDFKDMVEPHKEMFVILDKKYIDLNFSLEGVKKETLMDNYNEYIKKKGLKDSIEPKNKETKVEGVSTMKTTKPVKKKEEPQEEDEAVIEQQKADAVSEEEYEEEHSGELEEPEYMDEEDSLSKEDIDELAGANDDEDYGDDEGVPDEIGENDGNDFVSDEESEEGRAYP